MNNFVEEGMREEKDAAKGRTETVDVEMKVVRVGR